MKILAIRAVFPKGLSSLVLAAFPNQNIYFLYILIYIYYIYINLNPIIKPEFISDSPPLHPHWIAGFTQADGTFALNITKQVRMKVGYTAQPQFRICQHERDLGVLKIIIFTMGCGVIVQPYEGRDRYSTSVSNITELSTIVIPFFQKYPLYGAKGLDFQDFAEGIAIREKKGHLTQEGLDRLKDLAYNMNTFREF
jgi:hypothetical protein